MKYLTLLSVLCLACTSPPPPGPTYNIEGQIRGLLDRLEETPLKVTTLFVPELSPQGFPLLKENEMTPGAIRGLRMIDGRMLVEVLALSEERQYSFTFWLEHRYDAWLVAGWNPRMRRLSDTSIPLYRPIDVPTIFAAPSLRGAPESFSIPKNAGIASGPTERRHDWLSVRTRVRKIARQCGPQGKLKGRLQQTSALARRCHEQFLPTRKRTNGRIILAVENGLVSLRESTIIGEFFASCLTRGVQAIAPKIPGCTYSVDLLLKTTGPVK